MDFKQIIKAHLDKMAQQDFAFAERYKDEKKSLDECIKYIFSQAEKKKSGNCAAIEDSVVYGWAVHYYQEEKIEIKKTNVKKVVTPSKKAEVKTIKALVKDKDTNQCVQLDMFADFGL